MRAPLALLIGFLAWLPVASAAPPAEDAPALTLERLMEQLAAAGGVRAAFVERKHLALLTRPLESEGVLVFRPPDWMARTVTRPGRARVVIRDGTLLARDETGEERLEFGDSDVVRQFVDNLAVVLRGDLPALRERHDVRFASEGQAWVLELEPRSRTMRQLVAEIRIEGTGAVPRRMRVTETQGDTSVTDFMDVETELVFSPEEREILFALDPVPTADD